MTVAGLARYLEVQPLGVCRALAPEADAGAAPARVLRALLRRDAQQPWQNADVKRLLPDDSAAAARALFALHRERFISVRLNPAGPDEGAWDRVQADLDAWVAGDPCLSWLALVDGDGLPIVHAGAAPSAGDEPVALPVQLRFVLGEGALAAVYGLAAPDARVSESPQLVALAAHLERTRLVA